MRTTLTLDDDVAVQIERLKRIRNAGLKQIINEALRRGLPQMTTSDEPNKRYRTKSVSLGRCLIGSIDDVAETLAIAEGQDLR